MESTTITETDKIFTEVLSLYNIDKTSKKEKDNLGEVFLNDITGSQIKTHTQYINNKNDNDIITFFDTKMLLKYKSEISKENIRMYYIEGIFYLLDTNNQPISKEFGLGVSDFSTLHAHFEYELLNFYKNLLNTYIYSDSEQITINFELNK